MKTFVLLIVLLTPNGSLVKVQEPGYLTERGCVSESVRVVERYRDVLETYCYGVDSHEEVDA